MFYKNSVAVCLAVLALCVPAARSAEDLLSSQMVDEARQWEQKGRTDLAANLWRKLLQGSPKHPEALVKLGMIEVAEGNIAQADFLLRRASQLPTAPSGIAALSAAIAQSKGITPVIETPSVKEPVSRISAPQPQASLDIVIRETPAVSNMTDVELLQSYQTPLAAKQRWNSTRRGLENLVQTHAGDSRYAIALARHLSYREATRRRSILQLQDLSRRNLASKDARDVQTTWRNALVALKATPADTPLYAEYLKRSPDDQMVRDRLTNMQTGSSVAVETAKTQKTESKSEKVASLLELARKEQQTDSASAREQERALLDEAMQLDPGHVPTRLALALYYQRIGELDSAGALLDDLIESQPSMPAVLRARATLYGSQQRWWEGLETLEKIPAAARNAEIAKEQQHLWVNAQVQRAMYFYRQGNSARSSAIMEQAQSGVRLNSSLLAVVAQGWSDIGQTGKALRMMRDMIGSSPVRNHDIQIKYARILLESRQDAELSGLLRDLSTQVSLTPAQLNDVNRIILGFTLRMTEALRESGKLSEAAAMINPALQCFDDPRLLLTMARIYQSAGNADAALELVERVIVREPDNLSHRLFAGELALAGNALLKAQGHASAALGLAPEHPRVLAMAGRVEKAVGSMPKAISYFERAQTSESAKPALPNPLGALSLRLIDNEPIDGSLRNMGLNPSTIERSGLLPLPEFLSPTRGANSDSYINSNPPVSNTLGPARL